MTCLFSWILICPLLLFSFVCPSAVAALVGFGDVVRWRSARRFVNQSGESGNRTEINKIEKGLPFRSTNLIPPSTHTLLKNGFCPSRLPQKGFVFLSCRIQYMRTLLTHNSISPARHSCVPLPQPVSYLQLRSSQRSRSV